MMVDPNLNSYDDGSLNPYAPPTASSAQGSSPGPTAGGLASRSERFVGAFIDTLIAIPITLALGMVMGAGLALIGLDPEGGSFEFVLTILSPVATLGALIAINGYLLAKRGQTVGKTIVKTQIVSEESNQILPFGPLILKRYVPLYLVAAVPAVGSFVALGNYLAIFRSNRKCIHDEIAGTKVIKLPS
jgi:uncharacterized RDD family membrane protein YckC